MLNFRGYSLKKVSFESMIRGMTPRPNLVISCESHLQFNKQFELEGYQSFSRNRREKSMGGIATSIIDSDFRNCLKVTEGEGSNEFIVTRHTDFMVPINVINIYGEQENRTSSSIIKEHWGEVVEEIVKIESRGEFFILLGNTNKHVGDLIDGNHDKVTKGGELIREFLSSGDYVLVNGTSKVIGGPFTRVDPADPDNDLKKSCLDLVIMSRKLFNFVDSMTIDKNRVISPHSINNNKVTYSDRFAIQLILKGIPRKKTKDTVIPRILMWNTNKEGGWEKYRSLTANNPSLIKVEDESDANKIMKMIEKELDSVKFNCFDKVKYRNSSLKNTKLDNLYVKKRNSVNNEDVSEVDKEIHSELKRVRKVNLEKKMKNLLDIKRKKGNCAAVFRLKEDKVGKKKIPQ